MPVTRGLRQVALRAGGPGPGGRRSDRGSALALVPAGFLVLIILGALAVDSAAAFLGQRQLDDALSAAANDAAAAVLSNPAFYGSGVVVVDPGAAARVVCQTLGAQLDADLSQVHVQLAVQGDAVGVRATAEVTEVFGRAIPGLRRHQVSAVAVAYASQGPGTIASPPPTNYQPLSCI